MSDDDWIQSAFADDALVVEQLFRLRESMMMARRRRQQPCLLEWGVRQPRSRQIARYDVGSGKKKSELTRASPTTPLSWSPGTSNSAGEGYEESSVRLSNTRSKIISSSDINTKRSRKKKTFAELKDQESFLLKEAIHLKRALASERMLYEKEKVRNESLKRLKLELQLQQPSISYQAVAMPIDHQAPTIWAASGKCHETVPILCQSVALSDSNEVRKIAIVEQERFHVLPDLNMLPDLNLAFEEDFI